MKKDFLGISLAQSSVARILTAGKMISPMVRAIPMARISRMQNGQQKLHDHRRRVAAMDRR